MLGKLPTLSSVGIIQRRCFPSGAIEYSPMTGGAKDASPSHSDLNVAWGYFCYEARLVKSKVRQGNECHSSRFQSERDGVRILEDGPKATKKKWHEDWRRRICRGTRYRTSITCGFSTGALTSVAATSGTLLERRAGQVSSTWNRDRCASVEAQVVVGPP